MLVGGAALIGRRILRRDLVGTTHFQDGLFLSLLFLVALTGTLTETTRLFDTAAVSYPMYSIHLVSAALLLALAPYTKFAHAIYRPLAMYAARLRGWPN
jgi:nitrate reductase gamma subunit